MNNIKATGKEKKVIYVYHHPESQEHLGWLKIGDQTGFNSGRIKEQNEADNIKAETLYMTDAIDKNGKPFRDFEVHAIIDATGKYEREKKKNSKSGRFAEWYKMTKNEAIAAIEARKNLSGFDTDILKKINLGITLRDEQQYAIDQTYAYWNNSQQGKREFLWNAKPRFGKTLTSYWFIEKIKAKKVLIVTNRPAISDSWYTDYRQFIQPKGIFKFGSTKDNKHITTAGHLQGRALTVSETKTAIKNGESTIFFISLQDIKGRDTNNLESFKQKNQWIFNESWDLFIIDESHEATETENAYKLFKNLRTNFTLHLSGTPFKALTSKKFNIKQIFNWTYEDEQSAKENWDPTDGENPYYELPRLNMFAYRLSNTLNATVADGEYAFDLNELFKTTQAKFVYEEMVLKFLDNMFGINSKNDQNARPFPFADKEIRDELKHTFWLLPGVSAVKALKKLMQEQARNSPSRKIFADYEIIDAAAKGDTEHEGKTALEKVKNIIGEDNKPLTTKTITLSCGQLTTGVTVKPWTAVLMLYGAEGGKTSATKYLQAAFRGQNPWRYTDKSGNDMVKENCYVFDFAPDRLLLIFQDYAKSVIGGGEGAKDKVKKLLNFLTVVAEDEYGEMKELDANEVVTMPLKLMTQEIVDGKFITSNKLFNIGNIFHLPASARDILNEMGTIKKGRIEHDKNKNPISEPQLEYDNDGNLILNKSNLGKKKYEELIQDNPDLPTDQPPTVDDLPPSDIKTKLEKQAEKEEAEQENAIHDHLRYFARAVPMILMAYGKPDTRLDNFEKYIDSITFQELVGITKEQFQELRDKYKLFNEEVFNASIVEFLSRKEKLADYYENDSDSDIFDYIPPQQTNQIYTPKAVVKMIIDTLEKQNPGIFKSKENTFLDPYMKSGLFITEIVKRLYNNLQRQIPDKNKRLEHILTHQVYGFAPSKILHLISSDTIFGFMHRRPELKKVKYKVEKNFVYFEDEDTQMVENRNALSDKIKINFGKNMKFTAIVGNPPYQGENHQQIYPYFYLASRELGEFVSLIFPIGWQDPKNGNNLRLLNNKDIKEDPQVVFVDNRQNVFPGIAGAEWTNIVLWKHGYNNGLNGSQKIFTNGKDPQIILLPTEQNHDRKPKEIREMAKIVTAFEDFVPMQSITSVLKPYGLRTDVIKDPAKYGLPPIHTKQRNADDVKLYALSGKVYYLGKEYPIPRKTKAFDKFKVFVPYAWGNMSEQAGLGGAYSDIIIAKPYEIVTETYQEQGPFSNITEAKKHAKFLMTKFARALLYFNKHSQHSTTAWGAVPIQNYSEAWWKKSVKEIDIKLMEKYKIPEKINNFVMANIQEKSEKNIIGCFE
ncbi:MAG: DEAD/DEAH box helicase family protein [Candidatus Staskawiczbacteria bacterium]|nr:DEAD/DEAH box helicase family protein [Candidatus Staskawiczbacteria bacterium]